MENKETQTRESLPATKADQLKSHSGIIGNFLKKKVKEVINIKEYKPGDWKTINKGLEKLGITKGMIENIQRKLEIKIDGKVGPETISAVKKYGESSPEQSEGLEKEVAKIETPAWIEKMRGNGGRDVAIMVSDNFDPSKETEVIYHFHGTDGHHFGELPPLEGASKYYEDRVGSTSVAANRLQQVADSLSKMGNKNIIVAYPISAGQRGPKETKAYKNGYDLNWMNREESNEDINILHSEVVDSVSKRFGKRVNVAKRTVKGHSAGGMALKNLAKSGFHIDRIDFLDASYGDWAVKCYEEAIKRNPNIQFNLFVRPGTSTDNSYTKSLKGKKGVRYDDKVHVSHGNMNSEYFASK